MKLLSSLILMYSAAVTATEPNLLPETFWPNGAFEEGEALDSSSGTPSGWQRDGSDPSICQVVNVGGAADHALAVVDPDNSYGEWYSDTTLAGNAAVGDKLDLRWSELYEIHGSEMRVTVLFLTAGGATVDVRHFVARGTSDGYTGDLATSTFTERNETIDVPEGAATLRVSLVSGGPGETTGIMAIDNLSVARHPAPVLLAGNMWTNSPTFEVGADLDLVTGTPENWNRGGSDPEILQVVTDASISPTHALAVIDNNNNYGEWYSDLSLTNVVRAGDTLNLQWFELYDIAGGEMRVTVQFLSGTGATVDARHFVAQDQSPGWGGSVAASHFTRRNESVLVPEGAATLRVSLVSGGAGETTGTMVIDDFSANKAEAPLPEVLAGNVWPNPGFESGESLDDPANADVLGWSRGGDDATIAVLSADASVSPTHALAVMDHSAEGYGQWSADLPLGAATAPGKSLDVQWFEMFNVDEGEMRLTFSFFDVNNGVVGENHFVARTESSGWKGAVAASTFTRRNEKLAVPAGARRLQASLVSGGPASSRGVMLIDNLSLSPEPNEPVALFGNFWSNPGFEEGTDLDEPNLAVPDGWSRGGADVSIGQLVSTAFTSSSHALALVDATTDSYGEWYRSVELAGKAAPGEQIQVQWWEMFSITGGEMRLSVHFNDAEGAHIESHHFVVTEQSDGWSEDISRSFFTRRNETLTIPANAAHMMVTLTSGGPAETMGLLVIDDLSFAKPPPPPELLAGNVWPNPTFEEGTQLDNPTLGLPDGGWSRGGNNIPGDQVTTSRATSPTHALAVIDTKEDAYSEWYVSKPIDGLFAPGDTVDVQWKQLYDTTGQMRLSFYYRAEDQTVIGQQDFSVSGQSPDWTGDIATSPFETRTEQLTVPEGTAFLMVTLTSGGSEVVTGTLIIDDFSMRPATSGFQLGGVSKVDGGWEISWQGQAGKIYSVESTGDLGTPFQAVPGLESVAGSDEGTTKAADVRSNLGPIQYFRVVELP